MKALPLAAALLLAATAGPLGAALGPACPAGEGRQLALPQGPTLVCLFPVQVLAPGARIVQQAPGGPVEVSQAGLRTLGGFVLGDPGSFVRLVEAPGYRAGVVLSSAGWAWVHPDGTVRTQPLTPAHTTPWVEPGNLGAPGSPGQVRLLVDADAGFLQDRGASWHLDALAIVNVVDGAYRAQAEVGFQVAQLEGGNPPGAEPDHHVRLVLAGNAPGISPLGYASLAAVYLHPMNGPGIAWVRTSPALARPESCYGGPYEGTLYGGVSVAMHELGHSLDLPWVLSPALNLPAHDPWYSCTQDDFNGIAPWYCTSMGGWHGEEDNCLEVLAPRRPLYAPSGLLGQVPSSGPLAGTLHGDA